MTLKTVNMEVNACKVRNIARTLTAPVFQNQAEEGKLTKASELLENGKKGL